MVEPMIVGPTTVLICPIAGPTNERRFPQAVEVAPPVAPFTEGVLVEQPEVLTPV